MARAKARRPTYRRSAAVRRGAPGYPTLADRRKISRWLIVAAVVFVLILIPFVGPTIGEAILDFRDALVTLLGLAVLLMVIGLAVNGWLALSRRFTLSRTFWRRWTGSVLLAASVCGIVSFLKARFPVAIS